MFEKLDDAFNIIKEEHQKIKERFVGKKVIYRRDECTVDRIEIDYSTRGILNARCIHFDTTTSTGSKMTWACTPEELKEVKLVTPLGSVVLEYNRALEINSYNLRVKLAKMLEGKRISVVGIEISIHKVKSVVKQTHVIVEDYNNREHKIHLENLQHINFLS